MSFLLINGILLFGIVWLLIVLSMVWPPDSPWAPWWRTSRDISRAVCKLASINKNDIVYELGSGEANFLLIAATEYGAKGIGIEIDPLRVVLSKILIKRSSRSSLITIKRGNFFNHTLSDATVVFLYLVPKTLSKLLPKLKTELKPGTRIITYRYEMNLPLKKYDKVHDLRLYHI